MPVPDMKDTLRTFIAISLPEPVIRLAGDVQDRLRHAGLRLKWVRPASIHLTLQFLGDVARRQVPEIELALARAVAGRAPFSLCARHIGVFPGMTRPRVLWLGLDGQIDQLSKIQQRLGTQLNNIGFPPEKRPFKGHLTLGRIKTRIDQRLLQAALSAVSAESQPFTVETICLFKSELKRTGAVYTRLAEYPLVQNRNV